MAAQRMTRETFDAVVQERVKRYHVSKDQAMTDTLWELEGPSTARSSMNYVDFGYRDKRRSSMHDLPHSSADRSWDMEMRRECFPDLSHRDFEREDSGGRNLDRYVVPIGKERLYRGEPSASNRHISELENLRSLNREEFLSRDSRHEPRSSELDRPLHESEILRDVRSSQSGGVFQSQGPKSLRKRRKNKKPVSQQDTRFGNNPGNADSTASDLRSEKKTFNLRIVEWAKFYSKDILSEFQDQRRTLRNMKTEACKMMMDCFKRTMTSYYKDMCLFCIPHTVHNSLSSPKIDNELLDLLMATKTVEAKSDFFKMIKPFDMDMMIIQHRLINSANPLLLATNAFEVKHSFLRKPRELLSALKSTEAMCRKSIVVIGQTFAMISDARQRNVLEVLGLNDLSLKPSDYPNFKNSYLFGSNFISQLTSWLKNKENKCNLKSTTAVNTVKVVKPEVKTDASSQGKSADPKVIATIDQLLENAKKGNQAEKEESPFWFLFDEGSHEYKFYHQKFVEFQKFKDQINTQSTQTKTCKRSPEELACVSMRAMLYARKAQTVKRRLYKTLAFSRKRKEVNLKRRRTKASPPVTVEELIVAEKQELEILPITETKTEKSSGELDVRSQETPDQCSEMTEVQKDEELQEEKEPLPAGVDEKTKDTAIKLAEFVAQMGPEIEQFSMENSVNNPEFWFLREKDSPAYKFYKSKVKEFEQVEVVSSDNKEIGLDDTDLENIRAGDELQNVSDVEMDAECEAAEPPGPEVIPVAAFSQMPSPSRPLVTQKRVANLKVGIKSPKRVCLMEEPKVHDPVRIEYERPRGRGHNRIKKPADLQFANKKLTQQSVDFQMLSKMGSQEGDELGVHGSGVKNPINVNTVSAGEGLGAEERKRKAKTSTNLDAFHQKMMQKK